jgi:malonyl-ACP decarboxylase
VPAEIVVTGVGVVSAIGQGQAAFSDALLAGTSAFGFLQRPGRAGTVPCIGAEIPDITPPPGASPQTLRRASLSAQAALAVLDEAWKDAGLAAVAPRRIGIVVGGSNFQQRELLLLQEAYRERPAMLRPTYAMSFMDTDLCGFCSAHFGIQGMAFTAGGASASGQLAIILAAQAVASGQVDACIALGALMDLSHWECQALRSLGAMGSDRYALDPAAACRPFDRDRDGFIFGESCGAVVLEPREMSRRRGAKCWGVLRGWAMAMDGNRNPDPSLEGETRAINDALRAAGWDANSVDYVNPHGTGSGVGDTTEVQALRACGLQDAHINATKSLIGHGLSAAGTVEVIATLLQMRAGHLHPTRNLDHPIDDQLRWVRHEAVPHQMQRALTLCMGFGGINTALCWERDD